MRVQTAQSAPFDAVLVGTDGLDAEAIRKSVERRN
jgi:rare lipoprotein A